MTSICHRLRSPMNMNQTQSQHALPTMSRSKRKPNPNNCCCCSMFCVLVSRIQRSALLHCFFYLCICVVVFDGVDIFACQVETGEPSRRIPSYPPHGLDRNRQILRHQRGRPGSGQADLGALGGLLGTLHRHECYRPCSCEDMNVLLASYEAFNKHK